jgi:xanthine dehydrogenase accessory factor
MVRSGPTLDLAGEPREIGGHARDRYLYAPVAGLFESARAIGDAVREGEVVARIGAVELRAPLDGVLRGLTRDGVPVAARTKVVEVDPRGPRAVVDGLGERPARIADGVLEAVREWAPAGTLPAVTRTRGA